MKKDIFISHAWGYDNLRRDNHIRCKKLCDMLTLHGYNVWFDHYDMRGNIDRSTVNGINKCAIVIICFTNKYYNKINDANNQQLLNDNCYKEWKYSVFKNKKIIPIIMEPDMKYYYLNDDSIIQMHLNNIMYIDMTKSLKTNLPKLFDMLSEFGVYPHTSPTSNSNIISNLKSTKNFSPSLKLNLSPRTKLVPRIKYIISLFGIKKLLCNKFHLYGSTTVENNELQSRVNVDCDERDRRNCGLSDRIDSKRVRESIRL